MDWQNTESGQLEPSDNKMIQDNKNKTSYGAHWYIQQQRNIHAGCWRCTV